MQKRFNIPRESLVNEELMMPGMTSCQGCGASLAIKIALKALGPRTVMVFPACCACVNVGAYPYSSLKVPVIHCPFATSASVAGGVAAAMDIRRERDTTVMVWAGDGGTFDIGIQALSGAAERNDNILYVCYDNEAYMNTGIQRSSATPQGAWTTTTPAGAVKEESKKDIEQIMLAHHIPYMATASPAYPDDMFKKFQKARSITGFRFLHILAPCPSGWRIDPANSIKVARQATNANVFPIYEVRKWQFSRDTQALEEQWKYTVNVHPRKTIPVKEYLSAQGRFKMMAEETVNDLQKRVDRKWETLLARTQPPTGSA